MKTLCCLSLVAICATSALHAQIITTIDVDLDANSPVNSYYQLTGQSAFLQYFTSSSTSGGQLDNLESGNSLVSFIEVFPPPSLSDYIAYSYFGRLNSVVGDEIDDTSFVIALQQGYGVGLMVEDLFAYTEADLVTAFDSFDSPEFLDVLDSIGAIAEAKGEFNIPSLSQPGTKLDLIAFIGGPNGDLGVKIGEIGVTVVPEPTSAALSLGAFAMFAILRRRR